MGRLGEETPQKKGTKKMRSARSIQYIIRIRPRSLEKTDRALRKSGSAFYDRAIATAPPCFSHTSILVPFVASLRIHPSIPGMSSTFLMFTNIIIINGQTYTYTGPKGWKRVTDRWLCVCWRWSRLSPRSFLCNNVLSIKWLFWISPNDDSPQGAFDLFRLWVAFVVIFKWSFIFSIQIEELEHTYPGIYPVQYNYIEALNEKNAPQPPHFEIILPFCWMIATIGVFHSSRFERGGHNKATIDRWYIAHNMDKDQT